MIQKNKVKYSWQECLTHKKLKTMCELTVEPRTCDDCDIHAHWRWHIRYKCKNANCHCAEWNRQQLEQENKWFQEYLLEIGATWL